MFIIELTILRENDRSLVEAQLLFSFLLTSNVKTKNLFTLMMLSYAATVNIVSLIVDMNGKAR